MTKEEKMIEAAIKAKNTEIMEGLLNELAAKAHGTAVKKGFYDSNIIGHPSHQIGLIHSEVSELLETYRNEPGMSDKIPAFTKSEEEAADIIIRVFDLAGHRGIDIGGAILAKMAYNETRPYKHGKRF